MEILRKQELKSLADRIALSPVTAIVGPRQCGKTTLARQFSKRYPSSDVHFFDLENPRDLVRLEDPMLALEPLRGLVVIDEIQRRPELFPVLRVLADRKQKVKVLILGSASPHLLAQSSETLAGRISYLELSGFFIEETGAKEIRKLWVRGGFPRSFLAARQSASFQWRQDFISTFLERDIPNLGIRVPASNLRKFWTMLAHYHGQIFNSTEVAGSLCLSDSTAKHYLDILSDTFMVRQLKPWFYSTKKRLVKRPKLYFRDSGIFHALLGLHNENELLSHPKLGASWEGFAIEQAVRALRLRQEEVFFWSTHTGAELDLVFQLKGKCCGIEVKYGQAPALTPSMISALKELSLHKLWVLYPGNISYKLHPKVEVVPLTMVQTNLQFS